MPASKRRDDVRFAKLLVVVNALVPGAILLWDAAHGQLGANGVNYALRTTGMLALVFLMLTMLVTPLRKLTGVATLIAYRRALGLCAFGYASLHFLIFFVFDRSLSVGSTLHEIFNRRYLFVGASALLSMVPLAATSTNGMVMRLGARRWKRLHRLAYAVAGAGVLHYYMLVKSDVRQPLAFAGVLAVLLGFRVVTWARERGQKPAGAARGRAGARPYAGRLAPSNTPLPSTSPAAAAAAPAAASPPRRRFWSGQLRVVQIFDETHDVRTFRLMLPDGRPLPFEHQPGQYLNLALTIDGRRVNRSYTIASSPTRGHACEVTVKRDPAGRGSVHLHDEIRVGSLLQVSAPAGRFVFTGAEAERVILLAGGVGITPLMSIVRYLTDRAWPGQIHLIVSARSAADLIFADELGYLQRRFANLHVTYTVTRAEGEASRPGPGSNAAAGAWTGARGRITRALLERVVPDVARGPVYLCGPDAMMIATRKLLLDMGLPESQLRTEAFVSPRAGEVVGAGAEGDEAVADTLEAAASPDLAPATAGSDPPRAFAAGAPPANGSVRFERSGQVVPDDPARTILETAEDAGVSIAFECRSGICGQCKTKLISGKVTMEVEDALTAGEKARGFILACQAHPVGDVVVDA